MSIPAFPSQDLAKLVLGYLAEEQLMTAYDEFLQASPYLDALRNEYDRIFMTSLKSILAEYRAVKIFVETCKPFVLRKKLVQCTNLLEVVKFLVNHVDVNKIQPQDVSIDKLSLPKHNTQVSVKHTGCDVCNSLNLSRCVCKSRHNHISGTSNNVQANSPESSVETTALGDLPGNHGTSRKKHVRVLEKETSPFELNLSGNTKNGASVATSNNSSSQCVSNVAGSQMRSTDNTILQLNSIVKPTPECGEKIEEFNNILNQVCIDNLNIEGRLKKTAESPSKKILNATSFQDFATGICGYEARHIPVPDSSTSEITNVQSTKDISTKVCSNATTTTEILSNDTGNTGSQNHSRLKSKPSEQKIKILSDIKVDNPFGSTNNATSTPAMQTIVINGTEVFRQKSTMSNNYTKDEIMAMPTLIVVPLPDQAKTLIQKSKPNMSKLLGPLEIDVSSSPAADLSAVPLPRTGLDTGIVKTVDVAKNASMPKDITTSCASETNTPQILPPVRKSSSTPRRNSHIRILDFNTPRRILHETINEEVPIPNTNDKPTEIVLSSSPRVSYANTNNIQNAIVDMSNVKLHKIETSNINITTTNDTVKSKKKSWDDDLRLLATANVEDRNSQPVNKNKTKRKSTKNKSKLNENDKDNVKEDSKKSRSKKKISSPKSKKPKRKQIIDEEEEDGDAVKNIDRNKNVPVKPTINVILGDHYGTQAGKKESDKNPNNKSKNDEANETPEAERISLQNVIGVKLNISDLLETPYKQALYDIQMETPKFLGPDLPDEPISDIKIMNIPTPRFFDTPKPALATPSSYSSRPTDYSSGGSYYKPDDQDYIPIPDIECPVSSSKTEVQHSNVNENERKKSRPVRKCTKNVSYFNTTSANHKTKETDDKIEIATSSCSESTVLNSSFENKDLGIKTPKSIKLKPKAKSELNKKVAFSKKYKSPTKKPTTFMKIKPRRPTPTKESYTGRSKRKSDASQNSSKLQMKKKTNSKEKKIHSTPIVACAPTKSRRKSSTPRKLHCTKIFNSESSGHDSPDINKNSVKENIAPDQNIVVLDQHIAPVHDSDTEQMALRWSDDGSQDSKQIRKPPTNEIEDITKIQAYIETTVHNKPDYGDGKGSLQVDLIKRGFDAETAKIIERDLLDTPPRVEQHSVVCHVEIIEAKRESDKSNETDTSCSKDLQIDQGFEIEEDEIELSIHECNEESTNYIVAYHDDTKDTPTGLPVKLKDKFCMEVCIDDEVTVRLRANDLENLFDIEPCRVEEVGYNFVETVVAVSSISNIDRLYTPLKDQMKATCYEIFDSTLTSLDTPLKPRSPKQKEDKNSVVEIIIEEDKDMNDCRKRKRQQNRNSPEYNDYDRKKTKSEAQYLLNSTDIQNIDIESVLKKLHGP